QVVPAVNGAKLRPMKIRLVVVAVRLLAGCTIQHPPVSQQPSGLSDTPKSQINKNRDRDLSDCERESALAGADDKRKAFDSCMKARGYAPSSTDRFEWPHTQ